MQHPRFSRCGGRRPVIPLPIQNLTVKRVKSDSVNSFNPSTFPLSEVVHESNFCETKEVDFFQPDAVECFNTFFNNNNFDDEFFSINMQVGN